MNKDKAIQLLERLQDPEPYEPMLTKDAYDAIQMAIEALSADGDTISREAAIEVIDSFNVFESRCDQIKLEQMIGELPPAQPEQLGTNLAEVGMDCISRQAAIDALDEQIEQCDKSLSSFDISIKDEFAVKVERASLVTFRETLEYLPTAEPQRIKGKWALQSDDYHEYYECDQCGMAVGLDDVRNFCPNCGAKMEVTE